MIDQFEVTHGGIDDLRPRKEIINVPKRGVKRSASSANLDCGAATSRRRQEPLLQLPNNPQPDYRNELTLSLTCPADVGIDFSVEAIASHRIPASDTVNDTGIGFDLVDDRYDWTPTLGQPRISSAEAVQVEANPSALDVDRRSMITPQPLSNRDISATSFAPPSSPVTISTVFAAPADNSQHVVAGSTPPLQAPSGRKARAQRKHKELKPSRLQPESKLNWTGVHQTNNTWDTTLSNPAANASIRRLRAAEADFEKSGTLLGPSSITASRRYPGKGNKEINADGDSEVNLDEIVGVLDNMLPSKVAGVYASSHQKSNSSDGYVTVAAQADGVHVLDVSDLHPVISHTLGPSTSFQCPPLSVASSSTRTTTYAIISTSTELSSAEESGRTLWAWEDDSSAQEKQKAKRAKTIDITGASCSSEGVLTILVKDGTWRSYRIQGDSLTDLAPPITLSVSSTPLSNALLALTASYVLLATLSSQEINILLWDVQFAVLLASHSFPVPSSLSSSSLQLRLVAGSHSHQSQKTKTQVVNGQAILVISSVPTKRRQDEPSDAPQQKGTSVLLVVPYTVPSQSTIAAAMGRGAAGKKWLKASGTANDASVSQKGAEETAKEKVLGTMRAAISSGRAQAAVAAFMKWAPKEGQKTTSALQHNFVKEVLELVLPAPDSKAPSAYASEIVRYLLERQLVCSSMISMSGGLLGALRLRADWKSIQLAFEKVPDLTELELVETLRFVIAHERLSSACDAMQVDQATSADNPLPLAAYLGLLANYSTSRGPLLLAFRRYLQDPEDVTRVLRVLEIWVERRGNMGENLFPSNKELTKTNQGVWIVSGKKAGSQDVPPLEQIVSLLQTLLDASFLVLLPHKPAPQEPAHTAGAPASRSSLRS
ncbi:hypothetical protein NLJ89_g407 [Agrocybe chaxingu]|uniref:Uncharacterized protein n=1 Tax=Agrocybe chaxingu TaxID=84603 RepID=A0A9W8N280_9AGAR|nr:hypothetical protein NLJ89_g407 [Agrocybe chaxingu]